MIWIADEGRELFKSESERKLTDSGVEGTAVER
jgi:hypothetical protein